jgi:hypothetical protein
MLVLHLCVTVMLSRPACLHGSPLGALGEFGLGSVSPPRNAAMQLNRIQGAIQWCPYHPGQSTCTVQRTKSTKHTYNWHEEVLLTLCTTTHPATVARRRGLGQVGWPTWHCRPPIPHLSRAPSPTERKSCSEKRKQTT